MVLLNTKTTAVWDIHLTQWRLSKLNIKLNRYSSRCFWIEIYDHFNQSLKGSRLDAEGGPGARLSDLPLLWQRPKLRATGNHVAWRRPHARFLLLHCVSWRTKCTHFLLSHSTCYSLLKFVWHCETCVSVRLLRELRENTEVSILVSTLISSRI